ncbi:MAG: hypothetical protein M1829_002407 [Trizodia sp. TS-e1964]|nr:MAG: hypothetical protein M1829_002407 [Trizodia sp. TS-e1964]
MPTTLSCTRLSIFHLFFCSITAATSPRPASSPPASSNLIRYTSNIADCYPRIFQPTSEFQTIQDDQEIPPGLHIRFDLQSGVKEAKINVPDEEIPGAENSQESGLVLVADESATLEPETFHARHGSLQQILGPKSPPPYSNHGKISPPRDQGDSSAFYLAISTLKSKPDASKLMQSLTELEELAHELYFGSEISKDPKVILLLMDYHSAPNIKSDSVELLANIQSLAASVLGSALQNNPTACQNLAELPNGIVEQVMEGLLANLLQHRPPRVLERVMFALNNFIKVPGAMEMFQKSLGMDVLASLFDAESSGSDALDGVRGRIATFLTDNSCDRSVPFGEDLPEKSTLLEISTESRRIWCTNLSTALAHWAKGTEEGIKIDESARRKVEEAVLALRGC